MLNPTVERRRNTAPALLAILLFVSALIPEISPAHAEGEDVAVDFQAHDLEGTVFNGLQLKGKIVLLDFWATWCIPCVKAMPTLNRLNKDFDDQGFQVVGIATYSGSGEEISSFIAEHPVNYRMLIGDEELADRFGVIGYPTYILIGPDGTIHKQYMGELADLYKEMATQITALSGD